MEVIGILIVVLAAAIAYSEGMLGLVIITLILAVIGAYFTEHALRASINNICQHTETIMRGRVLEITDKDQRRKAEQELKEDLKKLHTRTETVENTGLHALSLLLMASILSWPLIGIVALCASIVGAYSYNEKKETMQITVLSAQAANLIKQTLTKTITHIRKKLKRQHRQPTVVNAMG